MAVWGGGVGLYPRINPWGAMQHQLGPHIGSMGCEMVICRQYWPICIDGWAHFWGLWWCIAEGHSLQGGLAKGNIIVEAEIACASVPWKPH